jgi:hypothetical protein
MRAIAKAYGDEPLAREVVEETAGHCYLVNPDALNSKSESEVRAVGFARETVFQYDDALFASLREAFESNRPADLARLWSQARPLA